MALFGKRKSNKYLKQIFGEDELKKEKRKRRLTNLAIFFFFAITIIISIISYIGNTDLSNYSKYFNSLQIKNITETDLDLTWSQNKANETILKNKFEYAGLTSLANNISALTIQASSNSPGKNITFNYSEVAHIANIVLSYSSEFSLIDFVWEVNNNITSITTHYSYSETILKDKSLTNFIFEEKFDYNFVDKTIYSRYAKVLNVGENGKTVDRVQLSKVRICLTQFLLQPSQEHIKDVTENDNNSSTKSEIEIDKKEKTLCQMLGYTNLDFTSGGITFLIS